ncbi:YheC/YheD family protein [Paenibacillus sp. Marseille-Q4541]|uniref:YheC/YheD family endospore coat-associated protein n=1 Tax=Paenibacillus sp. Marseille-Q4541 TaxID=2831522 RepID=UPI001BA6DF1B|nr:YheC/YheD family protein [Paenibacillus sp. Marseille-Q4541]
MDRVGILLDSSMFRGIPAGRTGRESLLYYELAAASYGLTACYLRLEDIDLFTGKCTAYILTGNRYQLHHIAIPEVIHNRAMYFAKISHYQIAGLIQRGVRIYNVRNRYGKDEIHRLLVKNPELAPHLPQTELASLPTIQQMMEKHTDLIVKPVSSSIGKGIMRVMHRYGDGNLILSSANRSKQCRYPFKRGVLPQVLNKRIQKKNYLVQERIALATYEGRPFDLRVSVQRGGSGSWMVTGMYAKVAPPNNFVTNVAQGGSAMPYEEIHPLVLPSHSLLTITDQIQHLTITAAKQLSLALPHLADLGFDMGITAQGEIYFIECNGRDQRYGFRKAGMDKEWMETYQNPLAYARFLLDQQQASPYPS